MPAVDLTLARPVQGLLPVSARKRHLMVHSRLSLLCLVGCGLAFSSPQAAESTAVGSEHTLAGTSQVNERQSNLRQLRNQIDALRKEMTAAESARKDATDQLQETERAISMAQRELQTLSKEIARLKGVLNTLDSETREIEQRLARQQHQLEQLLYRQYLRGRPDPLKLLLSGEDPNLAARDLYYLEAIGRARSGLLSEIEALLKEKQTLATESRRQSEQLAGAEARRREEHVRLLAEREKRRAMLKSVADQIDAQRREFSSLQRDERRLSELIERLTKLLAARAAESREAARRAAQQQEVRTTEATSTERSSASKGSAAVQEDPVERFVPAGGLERQRGQLLSPANGVLSHRFGSARHEGSTWKGVFISAPPGANVRAIANGRVVFAEWMRGFGNLMIVDHGENYLSIYANNEALLKQVGDEVRSGDTIASIGNSGGNSQSGLYFEVRHHGKPLDPQAWINLK